MLTEVSRKRTAAERTAADTLRVGLEHHQAGRLAEAEACYCEILQREPRDADALHLLGVLAQTAGQYEIAIGLLRAAIEVNPLAADYPYNLGNTFLLQGELAAAVASYRAAILLEPTHAAALRRFGECVGGN